MDLPHILGRNVRQARLQKGMSQEELAFQADMKRSYLSDLERGVRNPSIKAIGRLASALGVEPSSLLVGSTPDSE
jgi:transcriptional regulator with XRE-family HTH domain